MEAIKVSIMIKQILPTLVGGAGGVTVSILHTGRHYPDDLSDTHIIYHYPETSRSGHDMAEVSATKNAGRLEIPIFVVAHSSQDETLRDVSVGIIQEWHDEAAIFLIALSKEWVEPTSPRLGRADGCPGLNLLHRGEVEKYLDVKGQIISPCLSLAC